MVINLTVSSTHDAVFPLNASTLSSKNKSRLVHTAEQGLILENEDLTVNDFGFNNLQMVVP